MLAILKEAGLRWNVCPRAGERVRAPASRSAMRAADLLGIRLTR